MFSVSLLFHFVYRIDNICYLIISIGYSSRPSGNGKSLVSRSSGLAMGKKTVEFEDYGALVSLLIKLLKLFPVLLSPDIVEFLRFSGVTVYESSDIIISDSANATQKGEKVSPQALQSGRTRRFSLNKSSLFDGHF